MRSGLHKITWLLLAFSFLNLAGVSITLWSIAPGDVRVGSAAYAAKFALGHAADDSWKPMLLALEEAGDRTRRVYQDLFFQRQIKFQYPPSSLLGLDALESISRRKLDVGLLNGISWFAVLALAALVPAIYLVTLKQLSPAVWAGLRPVDLRIQAVVLSLMTLTFYPITRGFALGQIQTWLTCLFAGAVLAWVLGREALSGVLIGMIVSVKPQLGLLLAWALVHRRRRFVIGSAATVLVLELLALWRYGLQNQLDYLAVLSYMSAHGESFFANQSVNGLLARVLRVGNNLEWDANRFPPYHPVVYFGTLLSSALMVAAALFWRWRNNADRETLLKFVVASLLLTMASPIAWEHHYGILAPIYAVLFATFLDDLPRRTWLIPLGASYILASNSLPFVNRAANTPWNFVQSYLFAAAVLLLATVWLRGMPLNVPTASRSPLPPSPGIRGPAAAPDTSTASRTPA